METRVCKVCGQEKPLVEFRKNYQGYTHVCLECVRAKVKETKDEKRAFLHMKESVERARELRLQDFTPRELMVELHNRGYDFVMTYKQTIKSDEL